jgi:arginyl-tRNA synthetase
MPMIVSDETPLYYLIPSANSIKVDKTNARQPINIGVTCKKRTGETGYITTDYGYVEYRIDDDKAERYTKPLDTEDIGE